MWAVTESHREQAHAVLREPARNRVALRCRSREALHGMESHMKRTVTTSSKLAAQPECAAHRPKTDGVRPMTTADRVRASLLVAPRR